MNKPLPSESEVVVIGGGVVGCAVAYHLAALGIETVLLERRQLTCGTTWHAAGLVGQLRGSLNMTRLAKYTAELYAGLEAETGQATGFRQTGSISIATTAGRLEELHRNASMAKAFGLRVDVVSPAEIGERYPLINTSDVLGGVFIPGDGHANAVDTTRALARGARQRGALIFEDTAVTAIECDRNRITGVATTSGRLATRQVVLCAGMWTRNLAATIGVNVPLYPCEHYYVVFENCAGLEPGMPVLRDYDACTYYKEDAGKILLGAFEPAARPWTVDDIPRDFCFDELPGDFDHFEPILSAAIERMPMLADAGIQSFFCGPESFTPDVRYQIGAAPEVDGCFVAAGLNSIGLQSAGGIGKVMAEWIRDGYPPMDLWEVDIRRNQPFQGNRRYLRERVGESLGLLYAHHWPFRQFTSSRGVRRSPLHDRLAAKGACFGVVGGWERANWFAPPGVKAAYEYSWGKQNWFDYSAAEHRVAREGVALFDMSSFAKFMVQGRDATRGLNQLCANNIDVDCGRIVYTQWLNERGGIEADLTVTRLNEDEYFIVSPGETQVRDFAWLRGHLDPDAAVVATDVSSAWAVLPVMGPQSRALLETLTNADLSNAAHPFGRCREIELGPALVRAVRITYVGELGWELYIPSEFALCVYEALVEAGENFPLVHAGLHAMNSLRIEKAYRHWGHDITDEDTPLEAGLMFAVACDKAGGFIGRDALLRQCEAGVDKRLVQLKLDADAPMVYHNEPIVRDGVIVGLVRSGMYGHTLNGPVALGYGEFAGARDDTAILSGDYEIEIAGVRHRAEVSLTPMYDPQSLRPRDVAGETTQ